MHDALPEYALGAEMVSASAIIVSLLYVGFQIKGNTPATQTSKFQDFAALDIQLLLHFVSGRPESGRQH